MSYNSSVKLFNKITLSGLLDVRKGGDVYDDPGGGVDPGYADPGPSDDGGGGYDGGYDGGGDSGGDFGGGGDF